MHSTFRNVTDLAYMFDYRARRLLPLILCTTLPPHHPVTPSAACLPTPDTSTPSATLEGPFTPSRAAIVYQHPGRIYMCRPPSVMKRLNSYQGSYPLRPMSFLAPSSSSRYSLRSHGPVCSGTRRVRVGPPYSPIALTHLAHPLSTALSTSRPPASAWPISTFK